MRGASAPTGREAPRSRFDGRQIAALIAGLVMASLFVAASMMGAAIVRQVNQLSSSATSQEQLSRLPIQGLTQVRRELLRLDAALQASGGQQIQRELLVGHVQQSIDDIREQVDLHGLGAQMLEDQASELSSAWLGEVLPAVLSANASPTDTDKRRVAHLKIMKLEGDYAQLVVSSEAVRSEHEAQEHARSQHLLRSVRNSAVIMVATAAFLLAFVISALVIYLRMYRSRARTHLKLAALHSELRLLSKVAELTQNPVMITDREGRLEWFNSAFETLTGWTLHEARGHSPGQLLQGPGTDRQTRHRMHEAISTAHGFVEEVTNYHRDGTEFRIRLDVQPIFDGSSEPTHYVAVGTDVTRMYQTEMHWRLAKQAADDAAREKSTFLAMLSHEMLTPLNAVMGALTLLSRDDDRGQDVLWGTALSSAEEIRRHVTNLLTYSALDSGRWVAHPAPTDLRALVAACVERLSTQAHRRGDVVLVDVEPGVPTMTVTDESQLEQLLMNLLHNALDATENGSVHVQVSLAQQSAANQVVSVTVSDTGSGLDAADQARLEALFLNLEDGLWRRGDGTGLGLATCARIVRHLGGSMSVAGEVGQGAQFRVLLPLQRSRNPVATLPELTTGSERSDQRPLRVLVVEDNPINARIAAELMAAEGTSVEVVEDGDSALDRLDGGTVFDLVLMDINLPGRDGIETTRLIRRRRDSIHQPFIAAHTANALPGDRERFAAGGMDTFLPKPLEVALLRRVLVQARAARAQADPWTGPDLGLPAPRRGDQDQAQVPAQEPAQAQTESAGGTDPADLEQLSAQIGASAAWEVLLAFVDDLSARLDQTREAVVVGDCERARIAAHTVAGSASSVRASRVATAAAALESCARARNVDDFTSRLSELDAAADELIAWVQQRQAVLTTSGSGGE